MRKIKRFNIRKTAKISMFIIFIMSISFYITCSYYLNLENINIKNVDLKKIAQLKTLKDILLVIISICGTNFVLSAIIEVDSKNSLVSDIICNDVIASPEFYENMNDNNKHKVYKALERNIFVDHVITTEIFSNIRKKLNEIMNDYYFESSEYVITCDVQNGFIEKEITKRISIKSYEDSYTIKDFCVGFVNSKKIQGVETYKLLYLEIDGNEIDLSKYVKQVSSKISNLDEQNEYDVNKTYVYNKPLKISNKKSTIIVVKCKTRTTSDDVNSTFRVTKPCKSFSLNYSINQSDKYRLAVDAFGFLDDADDSTNNSNKAIVNIKFKDWIFKYDGVIVSIIEK